MVQAPSVSASRSIASFDHSSVNQCMSCHQSNRPTTPVGPLGFNHAQNGATGDCLPCHMASAAVNSFTTFAGAIFPHTPVPSSCVTCHSPERPSSTSGFVGLNSNTPFDYSTHGGNRDCITCHTATTSTSFSSMANWSGGLFTHSSSLTTCVPCHSSQRPTSVVNGFDHSMSGTGDCLGCHQASLNTTFSSLANWSGGQAQPTGLVGSQSINVTATQLIFAGSAPVGSTVTSTTSLNESLLAQMLHTSTQVPSSIAGNCAACHAGASSGKYAGGLFHASLTAQGLAQPTTCNDCHINTKPTYIVGPQLMPADHAAMLSSGKALSPSIDCTTCHKQPGNVWSGGSFHANLSGVTPSNCTTCHYGIMPTAITNQMAHTSSIVTQDCATCHVQPTAAQAGSPAESIWSGAVFHASLTNTKQAQPSACLACHASNRPTGLVPTNPAQNQTQFDHANGGMGECVSCHVIGTTWVPGKFHPNAGPQTSCNTCHASQRPNSTTGFAGLNPNAPFDYTTHGGILDCATCHAGTKNFVLFTDWQGGAYTHSKTLSSCVGCHSSQRPTGIVNGFNHAISGTGDCVGCHQASLNTNFSNLSNWSGGQGAPQGLVGSQTITVTAVQLNFPGSQPVGSTVTSTTNQNETLLAQMLHSSSQVPSSITSNCAACHPGAAGGVFTGGIFHASLTTQGLSQPTSCNDCHINTRPTYIVGPTLNPLDHAAMLSSGVAISPTTDCTVCHNQPGNVWSGGAFHANISGVSPTNCTSCHYGIMPTALTNRMMHTASLVTQDCASCHAQPTPAQAKTPTAAMWAGGIFHGKISSQPTTCNACHSGERPSATTQSLVDTGSPTLEYMNHASTWASSDCATCHSGEVKNLAPGTSPTAWSRTDSFHTGVASGVNTCQECHGLGNGSTVAGTGNTIPAGQTLTTTVSSVGNSGATITPYYMPPPAGQPIYDGIVHTDANVTARDCNSCHVVPPANAGPSYATWINAKFHANVAPVDTTKGKCANCHYNIMPDATFTAFNHTTLISPSGTIVTPMGNLTSDCSSCHTTNVGTNWLGAMAANHNPPFVSCAGCHGPGGSYKNDLPPTTTYYAEPGNTYNPNASNMDFFNGLARGAFNHNPAILGLKTLPDCVNCHTQTSLAVSNVGKSWQGGFIDHSKWNPPTKGNNGSTQSCSPCHSQAFSANHEGATLTSTPSSQACAACHTYKAPTPSGPAPNYGGVDPSGC